MDGAPGWHDSRRRDEAEHPGAGAGTASARGLGGAGAEVHNGRIGRGRGGRAADGGIWGGDGCGGESSATHQLGRPVGRVRAGKGTGGRGGGEPNEGLDRGDPVRGREPPVELSNIRFEGGRGRRYMAMKFSEFIEKKRGI